MNDIIEHDENTGMTSGQPMSMVQHLARAEIEQQIATARQYPRQITKVARQITSLVTINENSAAKCTYSLPRGGKPITGPSIRMAEILASQWGNCRSGARVVHVDKREGFVEAEGIFHDLETNSATVKRVRRKITDRNGKVLTDDMIIVTGNAACSIALRNAILGGIPEAVWGDAYEDALRTVRGDMVTLTERRAKSVAFMANYGWTPEQVFAVLGVAGEKDVGLDQLVTLRGMIEGIKSGETTPEELLASIDTPAVGQRPAAGQIGTARRTTTRREEPKKEPEPNRTQEDSDAKAQGERDKAEKEAEGRRALEETERRQREANEKAAKEKAEKERAEQQKELEEAEARHKAEQQERDREHTQQAAVQDETRYDRETGEVKDADYYGRLFDKIIDDMSSSSDPHDVVKRYEEEIEDLKGGAPDLYADLQNEIANI